MAVGLIATWRRRRSTSSACRVTWPTCSRRSTRRVVAPVESSSDRASSPAVSCPPARARTDSAWTSVGCRASRTAKRMPTACRWCPSSWSSTTSGTSPGELAVSAAPVPASPGAPVRAPAVGARRSHGSTPVAWTPRAVLVPRTTVPGWLRAEIRAIHFVLRALRTAGRAEATVAERTTGMQPPLWSSMSVVIHIPTRSSTARGRGPGVSPHRTTATRTYVHWPSPTPLVGFGSAREGAPVRLRRRPSVRSRSLALLAAAALLLVACGGGDAVDVDDPDADDTDQAVDGRRPGGRRPTTTTRTTSPPPRPRAGR
jgi:hypothetical protein